MIKYWFSDRFACMCEREYLLADAQNKLKAISIGHGYDRIGYRVRSGFNTEVNLNNIGNKKIKIIKIITEGNVVWS